MSLYGGEGERKKHYRTPAQIITELASAIVQERQKVSLAIQTEDVESDPPSDFTRLAKSFPARFWDKDMRLEMVTRRG